MMVTKRPYEPPRITAHGDIRDLTRGAGTTTILDAGFPHPRGRGGFGGTIGDTFS